MTFTDIIKEIRKIMKPYTGKGARLFIEIYNDDEICFSLYETEIPIVVDGKKKEVYLDTDLCSVNADAELLDELARISRLLQDNIDVVLDSIRVD